jgi:hypothetical protein
MMQDVRDLDQCNATSSRAVANRRVGNAGGRVFDVSLQEPLPSLPPLSQAGIGNEQFRVRDYLILGI